MEIKRNIPTSFGKGVFKHLRFDLSSGISVALVALPLSLGISIASGTPPLSGLISAIIGGMVVAFISGTQVGIKGPAAGLIVVTIAAMDYFSKFSNGSLYETYRYVLAVFVVSGFVMLLIGLLKWGKIADFFPSAVVRGMLAAIGLIILTKQLDVGFLGEKSPYNNSIDILANLDYYIFHINPIVAIITVNSLVLLILLPRIKNKIVNILPPPMWVMLTSIPFVFLFDFFKVREIDMLGSSHLISEKLLINIPDNLMDDILFPNFSKIGDFNFWIFVVSVTLVSTIENLASAKAIENLDPFKRKSKMNRDMFSSGIATIIAGCIGGLPPITVIARSSVNVNQGGRTQWSNFFHGLFVFLFIFLFGKYVEYVPLAALAAILIFTGFKLSSPRVFKDAYLRGSEQFLILAGTLLAILSSGLIWGIGLGIALTLLLHNLKSGMSGKLFFQYLTKPGIKIIDDNEDVIVKIKGIANFFNILKIKKLIEGIPQQKHVLLEFSNARLIDHTVLEYVYKRSKEYNRLGGNMELVGLDVHTASSAHPWSIHVHIPKRKIRLSRRQQQIQAFAHENNWTYQAELNWRTWHIERYGFFASRPVEYEKNVVSGFYEDLNVQWQISDITFDEGALIATEVYHTTVQIIQLPFEIPSFSMEKEQFADRVLELAGLGDIDFETHDKFSKKFLLHGENKEAITKFFNTKLKDFFVNHKVYHLESDGNSLMLFKYFRLASFENINKMIGFGHDLSKVLLESSK